MTGILSGLYKKRYDNVTTTNRDALPNNAPTDDSIRTANTADAVDGYTNDDSSFPLRDNNTTNEGYLHYSNTFFLGKIWLEPRFGQIRL